MGSRDQATARQRGGRNNPAWLTENALVGFAEETLRDRLEEKCWQVWADANSWWRGALGSGAWAHGSGVVAGCRAELCCGRAFSTAMACKIRQN